MFVPVEIDPPDSAEVVYRLVVGEGEHPGHQHVLEAEKILTWEDMFYLPIKDGAISHPDHDPTPAEVIPAGITFRVVHQRELTLDGMWVPVLD